MYTWELALPCTMWVLGVCTDHDHHHINWALSVRVDAAEDFLKLIKGGARGGQIGPAAMDHLSVGREVTVTHLNTFAHNHYIMFRLMSETCRHQKRHTTPSLFPVAPNTSLLHIYDSKLLDCKPLWGMYCVLRNWIHVFELLVCGTFDCATTYIQILMWAWAVILTEVREVDFWLPVCI